MYDNVAGHCEHDAIYLASVCLQNKSPLRGESVGLPLPPACGGSPLSEATRASRNLFTSTCSVKEHLNTHMHVRCMYMCTPCGRLCSLQWPEECNVKRDLPEWYSRASELAYTAICVSYTWCYAVKHSIAHKVHTTAFDKNEWCTEQSHSTRSCALHDNQRLLYKPHGKSTVQHGTLKSPPVSSSASATPAALSVYSPSLQSASALGLTSAAADLVHHQLGQPHCELNSAA